MKFWQVAERAPGAADGQIFASLIDVIGTTGNTDFSNGILASLRGRMWLDHCMVFHYRADDTIDVVSGAGTREHFSGFDNARPYMGNRLYRLDSNRAILTDGQLAKPGCLIVQHQSLDDIKLVAHRALYEGTDTLERLSILHCVDDSEWLAVNLYRPRGHGKFSANEFDHLTVVAAAIARSSARHLVLCRERNCTAPAAKSPVANDELDAQVERRYPQIPRRERQVMTRLLRGLTADGIACDLSIGTSTVVTYKQRLYARLGISTRAQLFALYFYNHAN